MGAYQIRTRTIWALGNVGFSIDVTVRGQLLGIIHGVTVFPLIKLQLVSMVKSPCTPTPFGLVGQYSYLATWVCGAPSPLLLCKNTLTPCNYIH